MNSNTTVFNPVKRNLPNTGIEEIYEEDKILLENCFEIIIFNR